MQKKINRFNYHNRKRKGRPQYDSENPNKNRLPVKEPVDESDYEDEEIDSDFASDTEVGNTKESASCMSQLEKERQYELQELRSYEQGLKEQRIAQLQAANEEDDFIIKKYEKLLKINRRKNKDGVPKSFNDGLDYALELCTEDNINKMYKAAKEAHSVEQNSEDEFADDIEQALGTKKKKEKKHKNTKLKKTKQDSEKKRLERLKEAERKYLGDDLDSLGGYDSELEMPGDINQNLNDFSDSSGSQQDNYNSSETEMEEPKPKKKKKNDSKHVSFAIETTCNRKNKKKPQLDSDEDPQEDSEFDEDVFGGDDEPDESFEDAEDEKDVPEDSDQGANSTEPARSGVWEDIYGRKRDKDGNVVKEETLVTKYVPPHLRAQMGTDKGDAKHKEKLQRLRRQMKGHINRLAESNVHRISIEIDNLYMQNARFDMNSTLTDLIMEAVVSHSLSPERMVLEHTLLVAILHANVGSEVGSHFLEVAVEKFNTLLQRLDDLEVDDKTLDNCIQILCHLYTFQIFKHKLIYDIINKLLETFNEKAVECILLVLRLIGFVLRKDDPLALKEMILKVQKRSAEAPDELKKDSRVRFMLDTLLAVKNNNMNKIPQYDHGLVEHFRKLLKGMITSGKYVSTFNIGLDDLLNVGERGKWWLVGSAWHGNCDTAGGTGKKGSSNTEDGTFSQQLLELARKQRMNTDDKRNVFCVIMSAEDYLDAFDKILRLAIKDQRIVASVLLHCCLSEKVFNPYYGVLTQKFCEFDRRYQLALQYAIWDRIKEIHSLEKSLVGNLAKLLIHLISEGGLALSVLKVIEFAEIDKVTLRLVRQIMLGILLQDDENKCLQVFNRIAPSFKLKELKDSLRLFLHHFLLKGSEKTKAPGEHLMLLEQRIKMAERMLDTSESRILF